MRLWFIPHSFFPILLLLLQGSSSFLPPYPVEKDECFLPDFCLHSPFKVPETWGNMPNRGKRVFLWVFIQNMFKPDDRGRQIYVKHLFLKLLLRILPITLFVYEPCKIHWLQHCFLSTQTGQNIQLSSINLHQYFLFNMLFYVYN